MFFSVDKIAKETAELIGEDKKPLTVPTSMLPSGTKQGHMVFYGKGGFSPAPEKTAERRALVANMLEKLLNDKNG